MIYPYSRCRSFGHRWDDADATWRPAYGTPLEFRCSVCTTVKRLVIDPRDGAVIGRAHYMHPTGYRYSRDDTPSRATFRLTYLDLQRRAWRQHQRDARRLKVVAAT